MRASYGIFASAALASAVFFACTPDKPNTECLEDPEACASLYYSSDAGYEDLPYSSVSTPTPSSVSGGGTSSIAAGVSSSSVRSSSSAAAVVSSSARSSSSVAATPACVVRTNGMPTNPTSTCFRGEGNSAGKCFICPSDVNCTNSGFWSNWAWDNAWPSQGWLTEVACGSGGGTSSATVQQSSQSQGSTTYQPKSPGSQTAKTTQYWDACKPSCSWSSNVGAGKRASSCNITGGGKSQNDNASACSGGNEFTCMNQAPWKVGNVSFGYAAINMGNCGDCYQLDFANGQVMVVMKSNIGNLNEGAGFDLMIPGGGVGDFNALTRQVQQSGVSNANMGEQYGGFRGTCRWTYSQGNVQCVKDMCEAAFKNLPDLKAGCLWYPNTLGTDNASWDNPTVRYQKVDCPSELTSKY